MPRFITAAAAALLLAACSPSGARQADSAETGLGLHEMPPSRVRPDVDQIEKILAWLDGWEARRKRALQIASKRSSALAAVTTLRKPQLDSA